MDNTFYTPPTHNTPPVSTPPGYGAPPLYSGGYPPPVPTPPVGTGGEPPHRRHGGGAALTALSLVMVITLALCAIGFFTVAGALSALTKSPNYNTNPPRGTFSVITVVGTIQNASGNALGINEPSYQHAATLAHIKQLAKDSGNTGLLLYMDTPGGGVFESDEVYVALEAYKQETGRPVWAYMHTTCASGGYYIACAANHITANRNTTTGSIGVYITLTDTSGLYNKLGIETVLVRSGSNKGVGISGVPITASQRAIFQEMVDEHYQRFVDIVAGGRGLEPSAVLPLADGRTFTGTTALDRGLVDELGDWEYTLNAFAAETGASPFYPNFSRQTPLGRLLGDITGALPKGETETALAMAEKYPTGIPMALYSPG